MVKTYTAKRDSYTPGNTKYKVSSKVSIENLFSDYQEAILELTATSYNPLKQSPQDAMKANEYPKKVEPKDVLDKMDTFDDVEAYCSEVQNERQTLKIHLMSGYQATYKYEVVVDSNQIKWEI